MASLTMATVSVQANLLSFKAKSVAEWGPARQDGIYSVYRSNNWIIAEVYDGWGTAVVTRFLKLDKTPFTQDEIIQCDQDNLLPVPDPMVELPTLHDGTRVYSNGTFWVLIGETSDGTPFRSYASKPGWKLLTKKASM